MDLPITVARSLVIRLSILIFCYFFLQVLTINHFLYSLLKGRYLSYQIAFYVALIIASIIVSPPWNVSRGKWQALLLMCIAGYLSSSIAFIIEAFVAYGFQGFQSPRFVQSMLLSPFFSLGWMIGGFVGLMIIKLEPIALRWLIGCK